MLQGERLLSTEGPNAKTAARRIHGDGKEPGGRQPSAHRGRIRGHKRAVYVEDAVNPGIGDVERQKNAAGAEHAGYLGKSAIL